MKNIKGIFGVLSLLVFAFGCGASGITRFADESYKLNPEIKIEGKLALFSVMAAGSSSFNNKSDAAKVSYAPYSPPRIIQDSEISLPGETSMEGFRNTANDVLLAKFKQTKSELTIIPPKQVQAIINQSDISNPYLKFLRDYNYLSASPDFLKKLGKRLDCKYLMIPRLVVISNINDNSLSLIWAFGKRAADYSVIILGQVWDMSNGKLVWTGRGTSSTTVDVFEQAASFDELAAEASEALIHILP